MRPETDGKDHINIYSKGKTKLGVLLSNFAHTPTRIDGETFASLEAFWYYLAIAWPEKKQVECYSSIIDIAGTTFVDPAAEDKKLLRKKHGYYAKKLGKELLEKYGKKQVGNFESLFGEAMRAKVKQHPHLSNLLKESSLPFKHYYIFDSIVRDAGHKWILEEWELIREELQAAHAKAWLKSHENLFSPIPDKSLPNSRAVSGRSEIKVNVKSYTGVGSRATPKYYQEKMTLIAKALHRKGFTLRSGGASGADKAFEKGAGDKKEIFYSRDDIPSWCFAEIRKYLDPLMNFNSFKVSTQRLLARNMMQVLGRDGNTPTKFLICWTPDGKDVGGTRYALRCARAHNVPVYNIAIKKDLEALRALYKTL